MTEEVSDTKNIPKRVKKRLTDGVSIADLVNGWTQCHQFMQKKGRLCNMGPSPGSKYCGNHRPVDELTTGKSS